MLTAIPVNIGLSPTGPQGPRCTRPLLVNGVFVANNQPLSNVSSYDLAMEDEQGAINNIQTMFFDTSFSPSAFIVFFQETGQRFVLPAKSQGYIPIACGSNLKFQTCLLTPGGNASGYAMTLQFFNVPIQPCTWIACDTTRVFSKAVAMVQAGGTANPSGGVAPVNMIPPGIDYNVSGTQVGGLPQISQPWAFQTYGIDFIIKGGDASTLMVFQINALTSGLGGTANVHVGMQTNATGDGFLSWRAPPPGVYVAGFQAYPTITYPAVVAVPTLYELTLYGMQI